MLRAVAKVEVRVTVAVGHVKVHDAGMAVVGSHDFAVATSVWGGGARSLVIARNSCLVDVVPSRKSTPRLSLPVQDAIAHGGNAVKGTTLPSVHLECRLGLGFGDLFALYEILCCDPQRVQKERGGVQLPKV